MENYESSLVPLNNLSKFALTLLIVVLAVGGVVLVVITLLNVRERKYEIGVLAAIGVNKVKVAAQFTLELLIVTMIGLALGACAGAVASVPVSNQLLASQIEQQQSQQTNQREQFGRDMQGRLMVPALVRRIPEMPTTPRIPRIRRIPIVHPTRIRPCRARAATVLKA